MNPFFPLLLTVFFSIFHVLGGVAMGQGVRAALRGSDESMSLVLWGAGMGGLPVIFDWFFLIAQGHLIYGLIGPILFIITTLASAFLQVKMDGGALISAALGSAGLVMGLLSIPLMLDRSKTFDLGVTDYLFGGCFVLLFVVIGGAFAWNGYSAMLRGISLDQEYAEREQKVKHARKREKE
jgi:hypothetical protein